MDNFTSTLIATLVGALIGALFATGTSAVLAWQASRARYQLRLDEALAAVIRAIPSRIQELDAYATDLDAAMEHNQNPDDMGPQPGPYELGVLLELARITARGEDAKTVTEIARAFYALVGMNPLAQRARLSHLPELIREWRQNPRRPHAWATFTKFAAAAETRTGFVPPPPWEDFSRNDGVDPVPGSEGEHRGG